AGPVRRLPLHPLPRPRRQHPGRRPARRRERRRERPPDGAPAGRGDGGGPVTMATVRTCRGGPLWPPWICRDHQDDGRSRGLPFETSPPGPLSSRAGEGERNRAVEACRVRSVHHEPFAMRTAHPAAMPPRLRSPSPALLERGPGGEVSKGRPLRSSLALLILVLGAGLVPARAQTTPAATPPAVRIL